MASQFSRVFLVLILTFVTLFALFSAVQGLKTYANWARSNLELKAETTRYVAGKRAEMDLYRVNMEFERNMRWIDVAREWMEREETGLQRLKRSLTR
ncbi:MAG: hypothetical protein V3S83_12520 [Gemmatimonadota bacterium]